MYLYIYIEEFPSISILTSKYIYTRIWFRAEHQHIDSVRILVLFLNMLMFPLLFLEIFGVSKVYRALPSHLPNYRIGFRVQCKYVGFSMGLLILKYLYYIDKILVSTYQYGYTGGNIEIV